MSNRIEPTTHIDIRVLRNLLISRINEGRDLMKMASLPNSWKKREQLCLSKLTEGLKNIEEAIKIKEDDNYEISENKASEETHVQNR